MIYHVKPVIIAPLDGNIFAIAGACGKALKLTGQKERANELYARVKAAESYDKAVGVCREYVEFEP